MAYDRDYCFHAVAALVMSLQDGGAAAGDVIAALEAAGRCEERLRQHAAKTLNDMIDRITPDNLHPEV